MTRTPSRGPWNAIGIVILAGAVTVVVGFLALAIAPPIWAATQTTLAGPDTTVTLSTDEVAADVAVPEGWRIRPAFAEESGTVVTSPNGEMTVSLAVAPPSDPELAILAVSPSGFSTLSTERVGAAELVHGPTEDGTATVGALVWPDGVVTFVMRGGASFDAELSLLLSGIGIAP